MLGPSLFGYFFPDASLALFGAKPLPAITVLSQLGLTLLMFQIGMDFEFSHLKDARNARGVGLIAAASITVPFLLGLALGRASAATLAPGIDPMIYSLFFGNALAITALPILGRILNQFGLNRDPLGVVAISAAALNDVVGWLLLAAISALAASAFAPGAFALQIAGVVALALAAKVGLAPLVSRLVARFPGTGGALDPTLLAIALCLVFALAIATFKLGIFAIFGGFLAGLVFHPHKGFVAAWRAQVGQFVLVFFLPVFFTFTGLRTNLLGLGAADLGWLALILVLAIGGKLVPVYAAARASGFGHGQSMVLGSLMNTRALMELIVLNIGYDLGFLPQNVFTMLVVMAVVTTLMTGPLLARLLPRIGHVIPRGVEA
jgi:Kef-type K+ transport system membrane component KefB